MDNPNTLPSNRAVLAGVIDPDAATAATYTTGWISMADFGSIQAVIMAGTLGTSATLDAKLTQGGTDSDKQAIINCRAEELDVDNSFTHVRLSVTVGTATSDVAAFVLGHDARYAPADDISTVDEVVS